MTPLGGILARRIAQAGPMTVAEWMAECLGHPRHGYYMTRDPLGAAGDFTTSPEISQMFGELLGLWAAQVWMQMGCPARFRLVELGPGRGTLMADALRATRRIPGFHAAMEVHLVEMSPVLRDLQRATLSAYRVTWAERLDQVPEGPMILLANEFFDALPVRQLVRLERGWAERRIGLGDDGAGFTFVADPRTGAALVPEALRAAPTGSVVEICPLGQAISAGIAHRLADQGGAALLIDYGYSGPAVGDTVQALRQHRYTGVLADAGLADLTAHVDFTALAVAAGAAGARSLGPIPQGDFLRTLGIEVLAQKLAGIAQGPARDAIDQALARLVGDEAMGRLFKALALTHPALPAPAGFEHLVPSQGIAPT